MGRGRGSIRWNWVLAWSLAGIAGATAVYASWRSFHTTPGIDFVSFWAAGRLTIEGKAALAYDLAAHRAMELTFVHLPGLMPFAYPPPFLLVVAPLGLFTFPVAFAAWIFLTSAFYLLATRRLAPLPYSIVLPSVLPNALVGQNGFLFTGLFACAVEALQTQPFVSGMLFGCFAMKPQLAPLIPVALIAARAWRAIAGAALSSLLLLVVGVLAFGLNSYAACAHMMAQFGRFVSQDSWPWTEMASVFAFLRFFGLPQAAAFAIQLVAAGAAASVTWRAWAAGRGSRAAVLASATLLVSPYLFTYDALLLVVPFVWMLEHGQRRAAIFVWIACLPPILFYFHLYPGPNTVAIAAIFCLWQTGRPARSGEFAEVAVPTLLPTATTSAGPETAPISGLRAAPARRRLT